MRGTTTRLEEKALSSASHPGTNSWSFTLGYETMQWMQLDQNGDANSWSLGEFLAQDEVRVMMLDPACTKSLTFREFVNGPNTLSKSTAISNSDNWTGAPEPRRTMAPSTTSLHRRTPSPPPALGHPSRPPTGCRSSHPNLSALGTEPTEPSRTPAASRAAPRSPAETGSARV